MDPSSCAAAALALAARPYAAADLATSPAWPAFCAALPAALGRPEPGVAAAAVALAAGALHEARWPECPPETQCFARPLCMDSMLKHGMKVTSALDSMGVLVQLEGTDGAGDVMPLIRC